MRSNRLFNVMPALVVDKPGHDAGTVVRYDRNAL